MTRDPLCNEIAGGQDASSEDTADREACLAIVSAADEAGAAERRASTVVELLSALVGQEGKKASVYVATLFFAMLRAAVVEIKGGRSHENGLGTAAAAAMLKLTPEQYKTLKDAFRAGRAAYVQPLVKAKKHIDAFDDTFSSAGIAPLLREVLSADGRGLLERLNLISPAGEHTEFATEYLQTQAAEYTERTVRGRKPPQTPKPSLGLAAPPAVERRPALPAANGAGEEAGSPHITNRLHITYGIPEKILPASAKPSEIVDALQGMQARPRLIHFTPTSGLDSGPRGARPGRSRPTPTRCVSQKFNDVAKQLLFGMAAIKNDTAATRDVADKIHSNTNVILADTNAIRSAQIELIELAKKQKKCARLTP